MAFSDALDGKRSHKLNESGRQRDRPGRTQRRPVDRDYSLARSRRDCAVCRDICGGHCRLRTRLDAHGARRFCTARWGNAAHLARWLAVCNGRVCLGQIASAPLGQTTPGEQPHISGGRPRNRVRRFSNCFLLRLASIVPFAPLSYGLGTSRIARRDFLLATWIGLLPGTFLYAYLGSLAADVAQIISGEITTNRSTQMMTWTGLVVALIALLTVARYARKAINQALLQPSSN